MSKSKKPRTGQTLSIEQALDAAADYHEAGELAKADNLCRRILQTQRHQPVALHMLGIIAFQTGRYDEAEKFISQAIGHMPNDASAHFNLGNVLKKLGRYQEAIDSCRQAITLDPGYTMAHYNLGNLLKLLGQFQESLAHYERTLKNQPGFAAAHNNRGTALRELGRFKEALGSLQQAIRVKPDYAEAHYNLGTVLQALGQLDKAVASYRTALEHKPSLAVAHSNLGTALRSQEQFEEALDHYQQAIAIDPNLVEAHNNLTLYYERINQLDQAQQCNMNALAIAPDDANCQFVKAVLQRRQGKPEDALQTLEQLQEAGLSPNFSQRRYFELGKLLDARGDDDRAFAAFEQGNDLQAHSTAAARVNKEAYLGRIQQMNAVLDSSWVDSWASHPSAGEDPAPVFIVGFPRSGTTLLDQVLDSHPRVQVMEEKRALFAVETAVENMQGGYPSAISEFSGNQINELRARYFEAVDRVFRRRPDQLFVDKFPLNIEYIPLITRLFPGARFVLACRHPCDVVLSNFMQYYQLNDAMANFFTLGDAVALYKEVMGLWLKSVELLPLNYHLIKYESLVADFEPELRNLFNFLDIEWDSSVLDYRQHAGTKAMINTPSYEQVTKPIYQSAKYRWLRYEEQLVPFMDDLAPFIEKFGYSNVE
jgi:tetratricopeptide (TPR) repeat protein